MKEISDYDQYSNGLIFKISEFNAVATYLRTCFEQEIPKDNYSDEELRKLIEITRSIRDAIFKNIDTHVLTIEHLADKQLCQRRARERSAKDNTKIASQTVPTGFTKVPVKSKMEQLMELMNKASPEQLEQAMRNIKK